MCFPKEGGGGGGIHPSPPVTEWDHYAEGNRVDKTEAIFEHCKTLVGLMVKVIFYSFFWFASNLETFVITSTNIVTRQEITVFFIK